MNENMINKQIFRTTLIYLVIDDLTICLNILGCIEYNFIE